MKLPQEAAEVALDSLFKREFALSYAVIKSQLPLIVSALYKDGLYLGTSNEAVTQITSRANPDNKQQ